MTRVLLVLSALLLFLLHGCSLAFAVLAQERPWSFVTAVGGLKVGTPIQSKGRWLLPIEADVSGVEVTTKPTLVNSAIVCEVVKARVKGQDIYLVLKTTLVHGNARPACPAARLGKLSSGSYRVWYGKSKVDRISLGTVRVAL